MTSKYRVWCLSWEEDEEHGSDVVPYDLMTHDHCKEQRSTIYVLRELFGGASDAAKAYADYVHDERDGYECTWPLVFRVRGPNGSTADFEVDRDYVPEFTARAVSQTRQADTREGAGE